MRMSWFVTWCVTMSSSSKKTKAGAERFADRVLRGQPEYTFTVKEVAG